jgi:hypothetical protein
MIESFDALVVLLMMQLSAGERAGGVAFAADSVVPAGTRLEFPGASIDVPEDAYVAFIDRDPMANWTHSARYLVVARDTSEVRSIEAHLPPFRPGGELHWRVVYRAPSVPDAAAAFPR